VYWVIRERFRTSPDANSEKERGKISENIRKERERIENKKGQNEKGKKVSQKRGGVQGTYPPTVCWRPDTVWIIFHLLI